MKRLGGQLKEPGVRGAGRGWREKKKEGGRVSGRGRVKKDEVERGGRGEGWERGGTEERDEESSGKHNAHTTHSTVLSPRTL